MAITINSLVQNQQVQKSLEQSTANIKKQNEALASGKKINSAADNAAGIAIVNRMTTQISGFDRSAQNINDGISSLQIADGGLSSVTDQLQRMRELAMQASNGTLSDTDRDALNTEFNALNEQISTTFSQTSFNGNQLLNNDNPVTIQAGPDQGQTISVNPINMEQSFADLNIPTQDISSQSGASDALAAIDNALDSVNSARANLGAEQNRLASALNTNETNSLNTAQARSRIEDTDFAKSVAELVKSRTQNEASIMLGVQANADRGSLLKLLG